MTTKSSTKAPSGPVPFTDDHETWRKTLSILAGVREVLAEVRDQCEEIQRQNPNRMSAPGISERIHLGQALQEVNRDLATELGRIAKANGMTMPEGLR